MAHELTRRTLFAAGATAGLTTASFAAADAAPTHGRSPGDSPDQERGHRSAPHAIIDVLSDVQGGLDNLRNLAMPALGSHTGSDAADALILNGDLVNDGSQDAWDEFEDALTASPHPSDQVIRSNGNHEFYGSDGSDVYVERFLEHAGRDQVWTEEVIGGVPVLVIGSEEYEYPDQTGNGPFVRFSEEQLDWLDSRLSHWADREAPVLLFSHQVLPNTVSGTDLEFYADDYGDQLDDLLETLARNPPTALLTSHTHWGLHRSDWTADQDLDGHALAVFNTGAVLNEYGPDGEGGETGIDGTHCSGLRVHVDDGRVRVQAWDFVDEPSIINERTLEI